MPARIFSCLLLLAIVAVPFAARANDELLTSSTSPSPNFFLTEKGELYGFVFLQNDDLQDPVSASVALIKGDETIIESKSNSDGEFVFTGVAPGEYTLSAKTSGLIGEVAVNVSEYSETAAASELVVPVAMTAAPVAPAAAPVAPAQDIVFDSAPMGGGPAMGGAPVFGGNAYGVTGSGCSSCGGGGGMGGGRLGGLGGRRGWLGLVGLVGLAGLAGDDASPDGAPAMNGGN